MKKLFIVRLKERLTLVKTGRVAAYRRRHAHILLLADQGQHGPGKHDREVAEQVEVNRRCANAVSRRPGGRLGTA